VSKNSSVISLGIFSHSVGCVLSNVEVGVLNLANSDSDGLGLNLQITINQLSIYRMNKLNLKWILVLLLQIMVNPVMAATTTLNLGETPLVANAPESYTVTERDDLLSVLGHFVEDPLKASGLWRQKPDIHPWDEIVLINQDKGAALQIKRGRTVKLSPTIKSSTEGRTIPLIPLDQVRQFLMRPVVLDEAEIAQSAYIIGNANDSLLTTTGNSIYVRGLDGLHPQKKFVIVRVGAPYLNPDDEEDILARETLFLGDAELKTSGDPAVLTITSAVREIQSGDRLISLEEQNFTEDFYPHLPNYLEGGKVIAIIGGLTRVAKYQVVVLNKGTDDGLEVGHVLAVQHTSNNIVDTHAEEDNEPLVVPPQQIGMLLVFKPYQRISFAIIMKSTLSISVLDTVTIP
jgi:hypothetical protein